jgi:hypothetical protein
MEITQEYNVDCASLKMVIVKEEIGIFIAGDSTYHHGQPPSKFRSNDPQSTESLALQTVET